MSDSDIYDFDDDWDESSASEQNSVSKTTALNTTHKSTKTDDDYDDYEDDFQEESLGEDDLGNSNVDTSSAGDHAKNKSEEVVDVPNMKDESMAEDNDYGDEDFEDFETSKTISPKDVDAPVQTVSSFQAQSTEQSLHQQALLNMNGTSIGNVASFASLLDRENNEASTSDASQTLGSLQTQHKSSPRTDSSAAQRDYDIVKKANMLSPTRQRQDGGIPATFSSTKKSQQKSSQSINLEPVSARTSIALLSMLGELSENDVNALKVSENIDHKLVRTLDWLSSAGVLTDGNVKYTDNSCLSQTTMQSTTPAASSAEKHEKNSAGVTLPGSIDEAVMKLIVECVLENIDDQAPKKPEENNAPSPSALKFTPRERNMPTQWTVAEDDTRVHDLMPMVEENYLEMVKRVTKINVDEMNFPSDFEFSQYASHQRLLKIKKHMVEIMCDIFTDPSVIQTVKMGVTSRVLNEEDNEMRRLYKKN